VKHSRTSGSTVRPGSVAPPVSLNDSPHSRISLRDLRGRRSVRVFYVADWHPVAAEQLRQLEDLRTRIGDGGPALIGISIDATWSHAAFARDLGIEFPLLADDRPPGAIARAYGVDSTDTGRSRRAIVVIDAGGIVRWSAVFPDALNPGLDGILTALEAFAAPGETSPSG
jgi:peroxiredoxin